MIVTAVPGQAISTTIDLPQPAKGEVSWFIRDFNNNLVLRGHSAATGSAVLVSGVLPDSCLVPTDGSKYSLTVTDGSIVIVSYFDVVADGEVQLGDHNIETVYLKGDNFYTRLVTDKVHTSVSITVQHLSGAILVPPTVVTNTVVEGLATIYVFDYSAAIDTQTLQSYGTGTVIWTITDGTSVRKEMHPFYTVTPRLNEFITGIRKLVDKAKIGDANRYLEYTPSDLVHAVLRGADFVAQSEPLYTSYSLDTIPMPLRDFVIKAGAIDLLRAQHQAEGMSVFDFQGLGTQLNIDRTAVLDSLISSLVSDLERLPTAKKGWLNAGSPAENTGLPRKRPIGVLGVSTGAYTNQPMQPGPFLLGNAAPYSFVRYGVWR